MSSYFSAFILDDRSMTMVHCIIALTWISRTILASSGDSLLGHVDYLFSVLFIFLFGLGDRPSSEKGLLLALHSGSFLVSLMN